jgi:ubiquinone/menaquinone biosynthesis C-methylase UbiE
MPSSTETFQLSLQAAETYEARFVPALFAEWAVRLVDLAGVAPGQTVLDVACGTGIVARTAAERVEGRGTVVGLDCNDAMLAVAARVRPDIAWRRGDAAALPFAERSFDTVLCQMALMFFPDRRAALGEMRRVVTGAGAVGLVVPAGLEAQPAYGPLVEAAARHAGPDAVSLLSTYWACGDRDALAALVESAGLRVDAFHTHVGTARFDSADALVATEVESTPLVERISDAVYRRIREDARETLRSFTTPSGRVDAPLAGHVVVARRRSVACG